MQIKFLFINAINPSKEVETRYPPLGIGYLVSSLRKRFGEGAVECKVIDSNIEQEIVNFKPEIIGISSVSQNYNKAMAYAKIAKKYKLPVICGGVHISMIPNSLTKDMDIGVISEGEDTICDLFELFRQEKEFTKKGMQNIKGIIYWDDKGRIFFTGNREPIYPLDKIPFPARDLFKIRSNAYVFSSRGCPYRCVFCASSRFWGQVRFFSAEYVVNEIQHLINQYKVKDIFFYDDLFVADVRRIKKIINLLKTRNILGKVSFSGSVRANLVNDNLVKLLKKMGVKSLGIGLESGNNDTLKYLKGENIDIKDNENAIRIIKKYGIAVQGSFVIGSPEEKKEDILETLRFVKKSQLSNFDIYVLTPFPGTPIWDYAKFRGIVSERMDWDKLNVNFEDSHNSAIILSEKLNRKEIYKLFLRFKRYQKRKKFYGLIKRGLRSPWKIPWFLTKTFINKYCK